MFDWPQDGVLRVPMQVKVTGAHLLAAPGEPLPIEPHPRGFVVRLPNGGATFLSPADGGTNAAAPHAAGPVVVKLTIEGEPVVAPPLTRHKPATASFGDAQKAFDGSAGRSWEAQKGDKAGWVEVDLQRPEPVAALAFDEPHRGAGKRGQKFRLTVREGDSWRAVANGETKGYGATANFAPVTGQVFRLEIFESKDTAAVAEFQLYRPE